MNYKINYELDNINRDLKLEELLEDVNQHLLKKYYLANALKRLKDGVYLTRIDNCSEPKLVLYNKYYCEISQKENPLAYEYKTYTYKSENNSTKKNN